MNQRITKGIILTRTEFGEADRIITMLTPDNGKLRLMARGVRRPKSKLAGGVELFSVSDISFIKGKGEIGTLISARLVSHYGNIVKDVQRTMLGYELIKQLNKATEDAPETEYFELLLELFAALDELTIPLEIIRFWFAAQMLELAGYTPNLVTDTTGEKLQADQSYSFGFDDIAFSPQQGGRFQASHIKFLRLSFNNSPKLLAKVQGNAELLPKLLPVVEALYATHVQR